VSHYHCRKARSDHPQAVSLVLDNIHSVVRQAPFQCSPCKFYCNTVASFKQHWTSKEHERTDAKVTTPSVRGNFITTDEIVSYRKKKTESNKE
jgi:hypothetical protein